MDPKAGNPDKYGGIKTRFEGIGYRFYFRIILGAVLLSATYCPGQEKQVVHSYQTWMQYYGQATLNAKWSWQFDGGFRWKESFRENSAYLVRSSIGYAPAPNMRFAAGLAHLGLFIQDSLSRVELRPFQEFQLTQPFQKFSLVHRYRLEERIFYPVSDGHIQATDRFNFRFRYAAFFRIPLFKLSRENPEAVFLLELGDEIFLNFGSQVTRTYFDQNRLLVSPTFRFDKTFAVSLTWNNQFASMPAPSSYAHNQVFWLQVKHQLDFSKKKAATD